MKLLQTEDEIKAMVAELKGSPTLGVDTEFIRESTFYPNIALIQIANEKKTWLLDPVALKPEWLEPLFEVLTDPKILKVMHASFADQECFYWSYRINVVPVLDTLVAAALCGYGDNVGLGKLLKDILDVTLPKGRARAKWLMRPLPYELLKYAAEDVLHLCDLGDELIRKLKEMGRVDWALEMSRVEPESFDVSSESMAEKMSSNARLHPKARQALHHLVIWREDQAKKSNLPRNWVLGNEELIALAKSHPKNIEELKHFRGLKPRAIEKWGSDIMAALKEATMDEGVIHAQVSRAPEVDPHVCDYVRTFVSYLADKERVALRFLLATAKIPDLVRMGHLPVQDWVDQGILSPFAAKLIGPTLKEVIEGKKGLKMLKGRVVLSEG